MSTGHLEMPRTGTPFLSPLACDIIFSLHNYVILLPYGLRLQKRAKTLQRKSHLCRAAVLG